MAMIIKMPPRPLRIIIAAVFLIFITFILFKSDWVSINDLTPPPPPPERQHDPAPTKPETTETETSGCHFHEASLYVSSFYCFILSENPLHPLLYS